MAYVIKFSLSTIGIYDIQRSLRAQLDTFVTYKWSERTTRNHLYFELSEIRLKEAKPYCGNHAGPCIVRVFERPRRNGRWLEGEDWMRVHALVNEVLDSLNVSCRVYTAGADVYPVQGIPKKHLVVRTETLGARKRYDYRDIAKPGEMFPHYAYNPGTQDQFDNGDGFISENMS